MVAPMVPADEGDNDTLGQDPQMSAVAEALLLLLALLLLVALVLLVALLLLLALLDAMGEVPAPPVSLPPHPAMRPRGARTSIRRVRKGRSPSQAEGAAWARRLLIVRPAL